MLGTCDGSTWTVCAMLESKTMVDGTEGWEASPLGKWAALPPLSAMCSSVSEGSWAAGTVDDAWWLD